MKNLLKILCILTAVFCIYFPITYFHSYEDKREVALSIILTDSEEDIKKAKQELDEGKLFGEVTEKYTKDYKGPDSVNLGYFGKYSRLSEEVSKDVFNRKKYEYTEPHKTDWGWAIFKITDINYFSDNKNLNEKYFYTTKS